MRVEDIGAHTPLARWILAVLRSRDTGRQVFRTAMEAAGSLLAVYTSKSMRWSRVEVDTPLGRATELVPEEEPLVVGILGAAVPLVNGFTRVLPSSRIGFIAARRIETNGSVRVEVYYERLPDAVPQLNTVVLDPMLATGSTISRSLEILASRGARRVIVGSVIAASHGLEAIEATASSLGVDLHVYTLAIDPQLDNRFFIVPGLGDAGDRALG